MALPLVTLTPSCLARATISIRFFDETALAILDWACQICSSCGYVVEPDSLCGVGAVVHEEEFEVADVLNKESLVAGWHHVSGLLVATVTNLNFAKTSVVVHSVCSLHRQVRFPHALIPGRAFPVSLSALRPESLARTHLRHSSLALETSPHTVVDTLWLSPAGVHAHEPVALVAVEVRSALLHDRDVLLCGDHLEANVRLCLLSGKLWHPPYLDCC